MSAKHTPGPWETVVTVLDKLHIREAGGPSGGRSIAYLDCPPLQWDPVDRANGRLIAAAPELLAACESALALWEENVGADDDVPDVVTDLRSAVAKARGEK